MPILYAERIRLRASEREDIPLFLKWVNDPDVCENLEQTTVLNRVHEEAWFENVSKGPSEELPLVIEVRQETENAEGNGWVAIGNIALIDIHQVNRSAEIGIMIGEKNYWDRGFGTEAMRRMCQYGFDELNLHRIFLRVFEGNQRGIKAYQKAGFVYEGTMRQARYHLGRYWDVDFMGIIKSEWTANPQEDVV
ncbi:MAG: GNAT family protein [Anaerolineaceae bacterium]|jgi:RimJ/RimL family protein N-acetyltransferase|nr:GNAT family protein [Anaerolineaceae bacterium]